MGRMVDADELLRGVRQASGAIKDQIAKDVDEIAFARGTVRASDIYMLADKMLMAMEDAIETLAKEGR